VFSEELEAALANWDDKKDDLEFGIFEHGSPEAFSAASETADAFLKWIRNENDALRGMIRTFDALANRAFQQTFADDGTVISERRKIYFIQRWSGLYKELLDWGLKWGIAGAPEEFQSLFELQRQKALSFANEVRDMASRLQREIREAIEHPGRNIHVSLALDIKDGHADEFDRELRKALLSIDARLADFLEES
jgi:hypothetical protein